MEYTHLQGSRATFFPDVFRYGKKKERERRFSGGASLWRALGALAALCRMVASKRVMHKPKKATINELERMAISIAWKHAKLRKPLQQVRWSSADSIAGLRASLAFRCADGACGAQCIGLTYSKASSL